MGEYLVTLYDEQNPACLSPQEDLCLLYLFSSSISQCFNDSNRKKDQEVESLNITRELIKILPILLKKYKNSFTGNYKSLMETISLIDHMDFQVYLDLRMHSVVT